MYDALIMDLKFPKRFNEFTSVLHHLGHIIELKFLSSVHRVDHSLRVARYELTENQQKSKHPLSLLRSTSPQHP